MMKQDDAAMLDHVYTEEISEQCRFAIGSARGINQALKEMPSPSTDAPLDFDEHRKAQRQAEDRLWFSIRALLSAAANISKILFPNPGRARAKDFPDRGERLRSRLSVPDDSPLANRDLRNHFEHLDERLEEWWINDPRHNIVQRMIGQLEGAISGFSDQQLFARFDPSTARVAFHGDVYELQPLIDAIIALHDRAAEATAKPWWEQGQDQEPVPAPFVE